MGEENYISISHNKIMLPKFNELETRKLKEYMLNHIDIIGGLEEQIKNKIKGNIIVIPDHPSPIQRQNLENAAIILNIIKQVALDHFAEVVKGAHITVEDNGKLYEALIGTGLLRKRSSSHYPDNQLASDASMQGGEIFRELLIGKTPSGKTWFQLERHSVGSLKNFLWHIADYIHYKISGKNVGQYGVSEHVDSKPIQISKDYQESSCIKK